MKNGYTGCVMVALKPRVRGLLSAPELHMTLIYGIHESQMSEVIELMKKQSLPDTVTLDGTLTYFDNADATHAIYKAIDFYGWFGELHDLIVQNFDVKETYRHYRPHVSVATLDPGKRLRVPSTERIQVRTNGYLFSWGEENARTKVRVNEAFDVPTESRPLHLELAKTRPQSSMISRYMQAQFEAASKSKLPRIPTCEDTDLEYALPDAELWTLAQDTQQIITDNKKATMESLSSFVRRSLNESDAQDKYQAFFKEKLEKYGVGSPAELDEEEKKKFFAEIKKEWKG